ncbi:MAG: hypothetical protein AAGC43_04575 [Bacteroidota bacterium]
MKKENKSEVMRVTPTEKGIVETIRESTREVIVDKEVIHKIYNEGELWFVLPDAHYPYQDKKLMRKVFQMIEDNEVTGVVISGDWLDLYPLGSYNSMSVGLLKNVDLTKEYKAGLQGIKDLEAVLSPEAKKVFIWGNHEDRYFRTLNSRDNAKFGSELSHPNDALELELRGWEVLENWKDDFYTVGDLDIMHGMFTNIHVAKKHLEAHGRSVMFGHTHRVQTHFTAHEGAFNIGCLADITHPAFGYMPRMQRENWSQGLAGIHVVNGKSYVTMITVRDGKFIFNGKVY